MTALLELAASLSWSCGAERFMVDLNKVFENLVSARQTGNISRVDIAP